MSERHRRGERREQESYRSREASERQQGRDEPWREERRTRYPDEPYGGDRESRYASGGGTLGDQDRGYRGDRDRLSGGFGSEYGAWRSGASFGFGREEHPRHETDWQGSPYGQGDLNSGRSRQGFEDTDWMPNRPGRGRGTWAGDWSYASESPGRPGGVAPSGDDYSGRGPKDYRRSDERIREEICDRLTDDPAIDASDLTIKVESGEVILAGFVASRDQKRRAEESAERTSGVRDVINQIRVSRADTQQASQQSQQSQQASRNQRSSSTPQQSGVAADREK